jgi:hypothetical protein
LSILLFPLLFYSAEISGFKHPKSPTKGVLLSIGSTVIPIGLGSLIYLGAESRDNNALMWCGGLLAVSGAIIGPDVGHFYAQQWSRGRERAGIRFTIGLAMAISAGAFALGAVEAGVGPPTTDGGISYELTLAAIIVSTCAYVGYTAWDIATVPGSVQEYNNSILERGQLHFYPYLDIRNKKYGLSLAFNF